MFFASRILIVEGDTEKLALPEYARRVNLDFDRVGATIVEVGGKRNIVDFVDLALSYKISVGFIYDIDSSDFRNKREEEAEYNKVLNGYSEKGVMVWALNQNYEDELRRQWQEVNYTAYCQKYPNVTKTVRARLLAIDQEIPIPDFTIPIIKWLANVHESVLIDDGNKEPL